MFDAGSIEAKLTVKLDEFNRDLDKAEARVKRFEDEGHHLRLDASFDHASIGKARKIFADLDNAISRDAANRLRSSPQGSVLGTLNALFSPHPVSGSPSASQSAKGGLLGKMVNAPGGAGGETSGGGGLLSGGSASSGGSGGDSNLVKQVLVSNQQTSDLIKQQLEGTGPGNVTTEDMIKQVLTGAGAKDEKTTDTIEQALAGKGASNVDTTDTINQKLAGSTPGNVSTIDKIKQVVEGGTAPSDMSTTDTVREKLDPKSTGDVEKAAEDSGRRSSGRWTAGFGTHLGPFFLSFHKRLGDAGDDGGEALGSGLLSGMGPGILGIGMKMSLMVGAIGSALAVLPAIAGLIGVGMGAAMVGGLLFMAIKGNKQLSAQFKALGGDFTSTLQKALAPIVPVLSKAFASLGPMIKSLQGPLTAIFKEIGPQIAGIFKNLGPLLTNVIGIMQAVAPAFGPFIGALEKLAANILPGMETVIKATVPFIKEFAGILGSLGSSLGSVFATAAPAIGASMKILGGLLGLVVNLLPIIVKLADIFAVTLAPVFTAFTGVVQTLLPVLTLVGSVIASFAGAVIGDLASAFGAVATLIESIGPSLSILAKAFSQVFNVLENTGVFAEVGDALELIAPLLGQLIGLFISQLAPILPTLIGLLSTMGTIIIDVVAAGLGTLISWVTKILTDFPALVPILGLITGAWLAWNLVMDANPMGLIVLAVVAVIGAITLLATHWSQIWGGIEKIAGDVGTFLDNLFNNKIVQDILAIWSLGLIPLAEHWKTVWGDIQKVAGDAAAFFARTWGDIESAVKTAWNAISTWLSRWWDDELATFTRNVTAVKTALATAWGDVTSALKTAWNAISTFFTDWWNWEVAAFDRDIGTIKTALATAWGDIKGTVTTAWGDIKTAISTALGDIIGWLGAWPGKAVKALAALGGDMKSVGTIAFNDMLAGIKSGASGIVSWVEGFAKDVVGVFKTIWGWFSPSTVMYAGGKALMDGLAGGIKDHAHKAVAQATSVAGKVTAGVAQWRGMVLEALKMEGLNASLAGNVLYQMQTESGGNQAAINLSDINAQEGDPSRGLMQVIGTTFSEYHWPGTSNNIYDPLANIAAALNYARNVYGPTLMSGGMGIGSGHGYALGGPINEPVTGYGAYSGQRYSFGERGPEYVMPGIRPGSGGSDPALLAKLDALIAATRQVPAGVGSSVGGAIGGAAYAASFRSRYPRGGA